MSSCDRDGRGRKPKLTQTTLMSMRDVLDRDRRLTVRTLSDMFDLSVWSVYNILTKQLKMSQVIFNALPVVPGDLVRAPQKKWPGVPLEYFLLHQDSASAHSAASTTMEIVLLGFGTVLHLFIARISPPLISQYFQQSRSSLRDTGLAANKTWSRLRPTLLPNMARAGTETFCTVDSPAPNIYRARRWIFREEMKSSAACRWSTLRSRHRWRLTDLPRVHGSGCLCGAIKCVTFVIDL